MRKKELKLVVTFHTTADAMAMEKACKENGVPGRIIPVPRAISAGCGLSWCADLTEREQIKAMMAKACAFICLCLSIRRLRMCRAHAAEVCRCIGKVSIFP